MNTRSFHGETRSVVVIQLDHHPGGAGFVMTTKCVQSKKRSAEAIQLARHAALREPLGTGTAPDTHEPCFFPVGGRRSTAVGAANEHLRVITNPASRDVVIQLDGHARGAGLAMTTLGVHCLLHASARAWFGVSR